MCEIHYRGQKILKQFDWRFWSELLKILLSFFWSLSFQVIDNIKQPLRLTDDNRRQTPCNSNRGQVSLKYWYCLYLFIRISKSNQLFYIMNVCTNVIIISTFSRNALTLKGVERVWSTKSCLEICPKLEASVKAKQNPIKAKWRQGYMSNERTCCNAYRLLKIHKVKGLAFGE